MNIVAKSLLQQKVALNVFVQINVLIFGKLLVPNTTFTIMLTMMLNAIFVARFFMLQFIKIHKSIIFCCKECRRNWYAQVWSQQPEVKQRSRRVMLDNLSSGKMSTTNSIPQIKINNILDENNIAYCNEYVFDFYSVDNYLVDSKLIIEVQGDYWHCSPLTNKNINTNQAKAIRRDKAKQTFIQNKYGINILYLWETDIKKQPEMCKQLISEYIKQKGVLLNYHSFNYCLNQDNVLQINKELIIPYQQQDFSTYKNKIINHVNTVETVTSSIVI